MFEEVATDLKLPGRHEDWGANILRGTTEINGVLREVDEELPKQIGELLKDEVPKTLTFIDVFGIYYRGRIREIMKTSFLMMWRLRFTSNMTSTIGRR